MQHRSLTMIAALAAVAALSLPALAATTASAVTPLNIRTGPGPEYGVIGAIPEKGQATILGCIKDSLWCQVSYMGKEGWAYSQYLTATVGGKTLVIATDRNNMPPVTYAAPPQTSGAVVVTRTINGTLIERPANPPLSIAPPPTVQTYVVGNPVPPVYLNGEVVEGVGLPDNVVLTPVPNYDYQYAYVNGVPVLVEPSSRRVRYIYR